MPYQYFEKIRQLFDIVEKQEKEKIEQAVALLTDAILAKKSIFAFGASHAGIIAQELYYRAGGLISINPIFAKDLQLDVEPISYTSKMERLAGYGTLLAEKTPMKKGDVLILHSVSGRNSVTIDLAIAAQELGVHVICITNLNYSKQITSRHPSGKNLYQCSDIVIDNHGDVGDAACTIDGLNQKVAPSSTVIGAAIVNTIVAETVERLVQHGIDTPPIFYSANIDGGDEKNLALYEKYKDTIHYRF
ncbi:SIS domain-containing protein [Gracilibacillus alcaliphilus]|uniref:SIS domain-containing protein n=1 Tax=Gracilibacillus alcaliphilus TaxID=1401441 RepID=UPI00195D5009|nr:SIS domain-containing protein [Gracilibacillus alcaliphilus]MBM7677009.1 putative phosphosugar-binding protein [Gracilibacillus alcaliphilus]